MSDNKEYRVWDCKIGAAEPLALDNGSDLPMRRAVQAAFKEVTGIDAEFLFSGWGGKLEETEVAVVENRAPRHGNLVIRLDASILCKAMAEISQPLADILTERNAQDEQWGGPEVDDTRLLQEWVDFIAYQGYHASKALRQGPGRNADSAEFRRRMVKIAALALAAIQSFDRAATP